MLNKVLFKKVCVGFAIFFLVIYIGRAVYEFKRPLDAGLSGQMVNNTVNRGESNSIKNYASLKMEYTGKQGGASQVVDQKYEKSATISASTSKYDDDEKNLNGIIEVNKCVIQMENKQGLSGNRRTEMVIGVKPDQFDDTVKRISSIGKILNKTETKLDKTAEYRQMLADRATLEKTKESYISLRQKGGSITELLTLEQKIIEIEGQIQKQSVDLGEYSDDNAFCTINFTISETATKSGVDNSIRVLWGALKWTIGCYLAIMCLIIATAIGAIVALWAISIGKKMLSGLLTAPNVVSNENKIEQ